MARAVAPKPPKEKKALAKEPAKARKKGREPAAAAEAAPKKERRGKKKAPPAEAPVAVADAGTAEADGGAAVEVPAAKARPPKKRGRPGRKPVIRFEVEEEEEAEGFEEETPYSEDEELDVATLTGSGAPARARKRRKKPKSNTLLMKRRRKLLRRRKRERTVRPSPPLEKTDPLGAYLAGQMVPCPVGCGGFSEVVRIATLDSGAGEVWFECLSCAQRRAFEIPAATPEENEAVGRAEEEGREPVCPRHDPPMHLRRRGRQFACPGCGVIYSPPGTD